MYIVLHIHIEVLFYLLYSLKSGIKFLTTTVDFIFKNQFSF